ncbi:MAG: hypothetical protein JWN13_6489 [Betaproteobacteria bacterium]|nr:hypothetical protein [Betaproteobacteria bacterium]MEA3155693.1 hypothetical protein [Betaproteobacteria bacterium]
MTVISTAFAPLAQVVGEGIGHVSLPIVVVPHPLGDRDERVIEQRGVDIAAECARVLTTPVDVLAAEFEGKQFPLPRGVMPR